MSKMTNKYQHDFERYFHEDMGYKILADEHQYEYVKALLAPVKEVQAVFVDAAAGTGKTSLALAAGYYQLLKGKVSQIVYVRNTVALRDNGFLPGTPEEKEAVFMKPLIECINRIGSKTGHQDLYNSLLSNEQLIATSTSYIRGTDIEGDVFLIIDEAQNLDLGELQAVLTRKHDSVKAVVIGSHLQVDTANIKRYGTNGLLPFEIYREHFLNCEDDTIKIKALELQKNYRGNFARHADIIHQTVEKYDSEFKRFIEERNAKAETEALEALKTANSIGNQDIVIEL